MTKKQIENTSTEETFGGVIFHDLSSADKEMVNQGIILPDARKQEYACEYCGGNGNYCKNEESERCADPSVWLKPVAN